jgi:hypothetical protein
MEWVVLIFLLVLIYFMADEMTGNDFGFIGKMIFGIIVFGICLLVAGVVPIR